MPAVRGTILALAEQLFMMVNISQMTRMRVVPQIIARSRLHCFPRQVDATALQRGARPQAATCGGALWGMCP